MEAAADMGVTELEPWAGAAAQFLRDLGNEHRLMILCRLVCAGEMTVTALSQTVGLSQSALSQHLSRLREDGLVSCRRDRQTAFYTLSDPRTRQVLALLSALFCQQPCPSTGDTR